MHNAQELALSIIKHAQVLHPEYTHEQQILWALGLLADIAWEKNLNDNIMFARLNERIRLLYEQKSTD